jgi:hypothetical protein
MAFSDRILGPRRSLTCPKCHQASILTRAKGKTLERRKFRCRYCQAAFSGLDRGGVIISQPEAPITAQAKHRAGFGTWYMVPGFRVVWQLIWMSISVVFYSILFRYTSFGRDLYERAFAVFFAMTFLTGPLVTLLFSRPFYLGLSVRPDEALLTIWFGLIFPVPVRTLKFADVEAFRIEKEYVNDGPMAIHFHEEYRALLILRNGLTERVGQFNYYIDCLVSTQEIAQTVGRGIWDASAATPVWVPAQFVGKAMRQSEVTRAVDAAVDVPGSDDGRA